MDTDYEVQVDFDQLRLLAEQIEAGVVTELRWNVFCEKFFVAFQIRDVINFFSGGRNAIALPGAKCSD